MSLQLDLSLAPPVLFLFGLSGAGKSWVGDLIGTEAGRTVYHADTDLTETMKTALQQQRPFTNSMRDEYFPIVAQKILSLRQGQRKLVVTQGVYKQRHRDYLLDRIADMEMLWVEASDRFIEERLQRRRTGIDSASAAALRLDFELPPEGTKIVINEGGSLEVIAQLNRYFADRSTAVAAEHRRVCRGHSRFDE
jgi:gluconate kinase